MPHRDVDVLAAEQLAGDTRRAELRAAVTTQELEDRPLRRPGPRLPIAIGCRDLHVIRALGLETRRALARARRDRDRPRHRREDDRDLIEGDAGLDGDAVRAER